MAATGKAVAARVEAAPDQAAMAPPRDMEAWPPLVLCAAMRRGRPGQAGRATAKGHGGLAATGTLRSDAERSLTHAFLVFGRDSSRGDLLFTQAVSLSASPCAPPLDRMAVTAYDQS